VLYLDTSALAKRYVWESGSESVHARLLSAGSGGEGIFTSVLTYAEMLTLFGRRRQSGEFQLEEFQQITNDFLRDWQSGLSILELNVNTMSSLASLTASYPLKSADAVHLSTAIWLRDKSLLAHESTLGVAPLEFWVADGTLARIAQQCGLRVFNPEQMQP